MERDTIAAISTPLGTGGIGVVRISGDTAPQIAEKIFKPVGSGRVSDMQGYTSRLGRVYDEGGAFDDAVCQVFRAPKSYTGENVVEISCHGGVFILRKALRLCLDNGARLAEPGEFTRRAFLNGKLSLTQAEAVMELISAQSQSAVKAALAARDGAIAVRVRRTADMLVEQAAHLAAWADFPEEDLEELDIPLLLRRLASARDEISGLLSTYDAGKILREGALTVIAGKPNVGKSTLMNLLAGEDRSIVTDIPGTTRDIVEDSVRLGDFVLRLADTAGIRETIDPVERIGVARSRGILREAELVLAVFDSSDELDNDDELLLKELEDKPCVAIINKIDLPQRLDTAKITGRLPYTVTISARDGKGVEALSEAVSGLLGLSRIDAAAGIVMSERQRICLIRSLADIDEADAAVQANMLDAASVCIDGAIGELLTLTGERASERVINEVFARFCVGK